MEPSAELRAAANGVRQLYVALTREGFDDRQALIIVGQVVAAGGQK
jgi:hypothetical protein